ncbi:hypothetical protein D3C86_1621970 [compost metagenome]
MVQLGVHRVADGRVAEPVRGEGFEVAIALLPRRLVGFIEHEEFVFQRREGIEAHRLATLDHSPQRGARANRFSGLGKLADKQQHAVLEGNIAAGVRQHPHRRVRVAGVPAGVAGVVVELVLDVPTEHHVAEGEAAVQGGEELAAAQVLAAHHPVVVEHPDLDVTEATLLDDAPGVLAGFYVPRIEHMHPCFLLWLCCCCCCLLASKRWPVPRSVL